MRIEDATKEELVWWIHENAIRLSTELKRFSADIMFRRHQVYEEKASEAGERCRAALNEYEELLKPYYGKPIASIPRNVLKQGAALERKIQDAIREQRRMWKAADRCFKQAMMEE